MPRVINVIAAKVLMVLGSKDLKAVADVVEASAFLLIVVLLLVAGYVEKMP